MPASPTSPGASAAVRLARRVSLVGVAALLLVVACRDAPPPATPPIPVTVARAQRRAMPFLVSATGTVEPIQSVDVLSQVTGVLERVAFHEGDNVRAGQVLFTINARPFRAALDQARAVLARDRAQADAAAQDLARMRGLAEKQYVTAQDYERAKATAAAAAATVRADEAAVENAQIQLGYATIRSPIAGRAGALLVRAGNVVRANQGPPLVVVNQMDPILVRFAVPASYLPVIQRQRMEDILVRAAPTGADTSASSEGRLNFVNNAVDTATGTIMLKGRFANAQGRLWPGEYVKVALQVYVQRNALVVPSAAVVNGQQGSYVFVVQPDSTAAMLPADVTRMTDEFAVLGDSDRTGVKAGDEVVVDGQLRLRPGSKVEIKGRPSGTGGMAP